MISARETLEIHALLIKRFGGLGGIRDKELLHAALNRPYQTFDGQELYATPIDKAAAILESIIKNHPFLDGNKRTGYVLAQLFLMDEQLEIYTSQEQKYQFVMAISKGELNIDQIKAWIEKNSISSP